MVEHSREQKKGFTHAREHPEEHLLCWKKASRRTMARIALTEQKMSEMRVRGSLMWQALLALNFAVERGTHCFVRRIATAKYGLNECRREAL